MSAIILSALVSSVVNGQAADTDAMAEFLAMFKAKAAKEKAKAEFEAALASAKAKADRPRKPRRSKVADTPAPAPKPQGTVTLPSGEKQGVYRMRAVWLDHCGKESVRKGHKVAPGGQSPFEEAVESAGVNGNNGGRCAYFVFRHYVRTGQMISEVDCYDLMRTGGRSWLGHFRKLERFVKGLVANK